MLRGHMPFFTVVRKGTPGCRGRVLSLDFGLKRCGLAVTDPLQIVAGPLAAVATRDLFAYLKDYLEKENVCGLLIGYSAHRDGTPVEHEQQVCSLMEKISALRPDLALYRLDEKYTSRLAQRALLEVGARKKDRRQKENTDVMSAILMLQEYLQYYKQI